MLTGHLSRFHDDYLYDTFPDSPVMSLASIFGDAGYSTIALHTYLREFYSRDTAYPLLGFEKFISFEDLDSPEYSGLYVSDDVLTELIIEEYENADGPAFIFAISMEGHQPYPADKYKQNSIKVEEPAFPADIRDATETFVQGLSNADAALGDLVAYFEQQEEETVILFFGDHQPSIAANFAHLIELGVVDRTVDFPPEQLDSILRTDYVIWSNSDRAAPEIPDGISPNLLGNYLLDYLGMQKPMYYHFLDEVGAYLTSMSRRDLYVDADGELYAEPPEESASLDGLYQSFQNELLYGESEVREALEAYR